MRWTLLFPWGGGVQPLYFELATSYSGYSDICNLANEGIDSGYFLILMSIDPIESLTSAHIQYEEIGYLDNGTFTQLKDGANVTLRVSNGILQANQVQSSSPRTYYYYICPMKTN